MLVLAINAGNVFACSCAPQVSEGKTPEQIRTEAKNRYLKNRYLKYEGALFIGIVRLVEIAPGIGLWEGGNERKVTVEVESYWRGLDELRRLTNNSLLYGGKLITQAPERKDQPIIVFANHAIMVSRPDEPTLKRLTEEILKDVLDIREARIQRLVDLVSGEIAYSFTEAVGARETLKKANETLMTRTADCSNKTILLASMLEQIGEEYILLYCPRHITVAVPQGNFVNENGLDFTWNQKPWMIAETTAPGFQIGRSMIVDPNRLTSVQYVQNPKKSDVIFDANSYEVLKFF